VTTVAFITAQNPLAANGFMLL